MSNREYLQAYLEALKAVKDPIVTEIRLKRPKGKPPKQVVEWLAQIKDLVNQRLRDDIETQLQHIEWQLGKN